MKSDTPRWMRISSASSLMSKIRMPFDGIPPYERTDAMKKISLTVSYEEEKVKALRWYLEQKGTKLEDELVKSVDTLFHKNVPANVRSYICKDKDTPPVADAPKAKKLHSEDPQPNQGVPTDE